MAPAKSPPTTTLTQNTRAPPLNRHCARLLLPYDVRHRRAHLLPVPARPRSVTWPRKEPAPFPSNSALGHAHTRGSIVGRGNRKVLVLVGALALAGMSLAGAAGGALAATSGKVDPAKLPKSLHGAAEVKAFTAGTVLPPIVPKAGSILFDPGPAYAYSTLDRDDY